MMRIHVCGSYGSGKSTFARLLSQKLAIPFYSLDDIKYVVKYSVIRSVEERLRTVKTICKRKSWITEGTWSNYADDAFKKADVVLFMDIPRFICAYRILKRYMRRTKHEKDTFFEALKLIGGLYNYHTTQEPVSRFAHRALIRNYNKQCFVVRRASDIPKVISILTSMTQRDKNS